MPFTNSSSTKLVNHVYGCYPAVGDSPAVELDTKWMRSTIEYMKQQGLPSEVCTESLTVPVNHPTFFWASPEMRDIFFEDVTSALAEYK